MVLQMVFVVFAAALPGIAWLIFFLREDVHPEPRRFIIFAFAAGIVVSAPIVAAQIAVESFVASFIPSIVLLVILLSLIEEAFKFFAAYWAVGRSKVFDEPIDAMIYMIAVALGLATIENFFILSDIISVTGTPIFSSIANVAILRFVGATFLHALASGFVGYYWAKGRMARLEGKERRRGIKRHPVFFGVALATLVHAVFNILILVFQSANFLLYPSIFLIVASFLLFRDFEELRTASGATKTKGS